MEVRRFESSDDESLESIRQGWCFGSDQFRDEILQRMNGSLGEYHAGALHREEARARAGRIIAEEINRLGWTESELAARRKSDPQKQAIAARLRKETTLWIFPVTKRSWL